MSDKGSYSLYQVLLITNISTLTLNKRPKLFFRRQVGQVLRDKNLVSQTAGGVLCHCVVLADAEDNTDWWIVT